MGIKILINVLYCIILKINQLFLGEISAFYALFGEVYAVCIIM
jgi:hypothetical protein